MTNGIAKLHFQAITGRTYHISGSKELQTWSNPQLYSINADGSSVGSYYQAADVRVLNIYVPVGEPPLRFFKLYVD